MYRILDCLSGEEILEDNYTRATEIAQAKGGRENGYIVEEVKMPVSKSVESVHNVPRRNELF